MNFKNKTNDLQNQLTVESIQGKQKNARKDDQKRNDEFVVKIR